MQKKTKNLINILIRTSNRPNYFRNCIRNITSQTYKNFKIIVSVDDDFTYNYVKEYKEVDEIVRVKFVPPNQIPKIPNNPGPAPWNKYFNALLEKTELGYVIYIDDDDKLNANNSLEILNSYIQNEDSFLMWQVKFPNNKIPHDNYWEMYKQGHVPVKCQVSTLGFSHPTKYNYLAKWTPYRLGDYRVATAMHKNIKNKIYINDILTTLQRNIANGLGRRDDLKH